MMTVKRMTRITPDMLLPQAERARMIAAAARSERNALIASGQASPQYRTLVDGKDGAPEESIKPGGAIVYRFNTLGQAAIFGLAFAQGRSPVGVGEGGGRYRRSWFVAVNGVPWNGNLNEVPSDAEVMIVNAAPYHRKIETGHIRTIGKGICEATRAAVRKRFPNMDANVIYADLTGTAAGWSVPYVLKGHARSSAVRWEAHRKAAGTHTVRVNRKDSRKGQVLTYPAVVISPRAGFA